MKKKLLLIMAGEPYTAYYYKKFSLLRKKDPNIVVKVWSLLPILNKKIYKKYFPKGQHKIYRNKNFKNIETLINLKKEFKKLPGSFYFANHSPKLLKSFLIERLLSFKGGKKIILQLGGIPQLEIALIEKLKFRISNFNFLSIIKILSFPINFLKNLIIRCLEVNPILFFVPNKYWFNLKVKNSDISKVKKINDYEYEVFKKIKNQPRKNNLIVFIDEMKESPYDHDLYWSYPYSWLLNTKEYWKNIDNFLSILHSKTGIDPIIAGAHRRRNKDFPIQRKFIMNKTPELIKNSKLVVGHSSTALHYAILFKKPIILLNIKAFKNKQTDLLYTKLFCELVGCTEINLEKFLIKNNNFSLKKSLKVDKKKYNKFVNDYLKFSGSNKENLWNKVLFVLKKQEIRT